MKNRIYVLVLSLMMSVGLLAQMEDPFQSTSTFGGSGSDYSSQISTVGATDVPSSFTTTEGTGTHRTSRKNGIADNWGGGSATDPGYGDEDHSPIGEPLVMLLFAAAAAGVVYFKRKKNITNMKQTFKFSTSDTMSRLSRECRPTVGRLSTLFLLLFALSFGFNQQVKASNQHYNMKEIYMPNNLNSWTTKDANYQLDYVDGNQFKKDKLYLPANTNFAFKIYAVGTTGYEEWWGTNETTINTSGDYNVWDWWKDYNCKNCTIKTQSATSGYVAVKVEFWGNYSNNSIFMHKSETAVSSLSASLDATSTNLTSGGTTTVTPGCTGGSGSYTYTYKVMQGSTDVTSTTFNSSTKTFTAPTVEESTTYTITVTAKDAHALLSGLSASSKSVTITVTPVSYTVTFGPKSGCETMGSVTAKVDNNGITSGSSVYGGKSVVFSYSANAGYRFTKWVNASGTQLGTGATYTISSLAKDEKVYAEFAEIQYTITMRKNRDAAGTITPSSQQTLKYFTPIALSYTTNTGYSFSQWSSNTSNVEIFDDNGTTKMRIKSTVTANGSATVTANYNENDISVNVVVASGDENKGSVTSSSVTAHPETGVTITAEPKAGYYFTGWTSENSDIKFTNKNNASTTIKTTTTGTVIAHFANRYAFRGSLNDQGNTPAGMPGWGNDALITFTEGTGTVQYSLQANKQYKFLIYDLKNTTNRGFVSSDQTFTWNGTATFNGNYHALLNTRGSGTYTFTITMSGDNPRVTLAGQTSYQITFGKGTGGSSITASSNNDGTITSGKYVKTGSTVTFTQTSLTGYEFKGWYTSADGSTEVDGITTAGVMANVTADKQVYAQYKPITYNITYPASPEHYTINTEAPKTADYNTPATFTVTPDKGYLVDVTAVKTGGATSVTLQRTGNTYTISSMPAYNVTINVTAHKFKLNGWGSSSSDKEFDANWEYKENLSALTTYEFRLHNTASGLKNSGYFGNTGTIESTITSGWTMSDNESTKLKLKTGIAGTYTFTYCEVEENGVMKPQIKVTFPQVSKLVYGGQDYPFTEVSSGVYKAGPLSLAANTTLSNNIQMYWEGTCIKNNYDGTMSASSHTDWVMERYTSGTYYIRITTAGDSKTFAKDPDNYYFYYKPDGKKLTAEYPSYWRGDDGTTLGWNYDHPMEFVNDVATIELNVQTSGDREMKVIVDGQYWTYEGTKISTSTNNIQFVKDADVNKAAFKFNVASSMTGTYTFTFNRSNHQMSVNYPDVVQYDITYTDAEGTKTIKAGPNGGRGISAANKPGYKFVRWDLYPDDASKIAVANNNIYSQTTTVYGKAEGCSITAIYTNEHFIYFKNIPNWGNVYVQFYSKPYFHGDDASTDKNRGTGTGGDGNTSLVNNTIYQMTRIDKTDVWYFDYSDFASNAIAQHTVAFTDSKQDNHDFFDQCQVVYRGDFGECAPMMVPINYIDQYLNQHDNQRTCYYGQGHWMKYDAAENTAMGIKLHIYEYKSSNWTDISGSPFNFLADNDGSYSSHVSEINLPTNNYIYHVKLEGCATGGTWYGNVGRMTSAECTNWVMSINTTDMEFEAKSAGPYTFRLSTGDGQLKLSAEYPLVENDFRVIHTEGGNTHITGITYKHANAKADTASFYFNISETSPVFKVQKCTDAANNTWADVSGAIFTNPTQTGIYNFIFSHEGENVTIQKTEPYTGKFYIRTEGVDGGMESYKGNADNEMTYYGSMLDAGATYSNFPYNYYKAKWIWAGKDVTFCIANDYSKHISGDFTTDAILNSAKLPQNTNVRFMWNSATNQLSRAYISGSTNIADRFLVMIGDEKMFNKNGEALNIPELNPNEINFADNNNWVYQADIKAQPGCAVQLIATYNGKIQYFIGSETETKTIISGGASDKQYTMRAVYDFKTNRLIVGWIPPEENIGEDITLGGDMLLIRTHQGDVQQIVFNNPATKVSDIQHIYGVLTLQKEQMIGSTNANYAKTMYWISFPFDVKLSEVFGTGIYGTDWIVQRYRGDLRAQKGWFKQDTPTFWEYMELTDTLKAYEGYVFLVDANKFNTNSAEAWKNSATEANFYFPSASDEIGIIHQNTYEQNVQKHECKIDRTFEVADVGTVNHMNTDSHWNVIGVPAFQNNIPSATPLYGEDFKSYYEWDHSTNKYKAKVVLQGTEFHTMHAYMVQFAGEITWSNVSVVKQNAPSRELAAQYADAQSYLITLRINDGKDDDQTYIRLSEKADAEFVLNEDMMKLDNTGFPNIYSFAGNYNVAYNETGMENQTINLGVNVPKNGNYTFSMPDNFNGSVTLVDVVEGKVTELNVSDYTVTLNKGTYNNRFQLVLTVNSPIVTNVDEINNGWNTDGKTKKLLINNTIYLINGGHIYNASGMELSK